MSDRSSARRSRRRRRKRKKKRRRATSVPMVPGVEWDKRHSLRSYLADEVFVDESTAEIRE